MPCLNSPFPSGGDGVSWDGFRVLAHECSVGFSLYNKGRCYNLGGGMHHNMDHGSTGMGLQESIGNGITTNLVWEGEKLLQG